MATITTQIAFRLSKIELGCASGCQLVQQTIAINKDEALFVFSG